MKTSDGCAYSITPRSWLVTNEPLKDQGVTQAAQQVQQPGQGKDEFVRSTPSQDFQKLTQQLQQRKVSPEKVEQMDEDTKAALDEERRTSAEIINRLDPHPIAATHPSG